MPRLRSYVVRTLLIALGCSLLIGVPSGLAGSGNQTRQGSNDGITAHLTITFNYQRCDGHTKYKITRVSQWWERSSKQRRVRTVHGKAGHVNASKCGPGNWAAPQSLSLDRDNFVWNLDDGFRTTTYSHLPSWPYVGTPSTAVASISGWQHTHVENAQGDSMGHICVVNAVVGQNSCH